MHKIHGKARIHTLILFVFYQIIFVFVSYVLLKRIGAFGCFDDCFNFGAGNFLLQGKRLYSQIFFNHQPAMAYLSAVIQQITHPQTLFELVKYHRLAAMVFADICGLLLIFRFGTPLFFVLVIFEMTKFYIFGDRFLAEGLIVYPLVYLFLLVQQSLMKKRIYAWEYVLAAVCSWFVFWMREPFMPLSVIVFGMFSGIGWKNPLLRKRIIAGVCLFFLLHIASLLSLPVSEYFFNVITINLQQEVAVVPWTMMNMLQMIAYPVFVILHGFGSIFQNILFCLSVLFCLLTALELFWKRRYLIVGMTGLLLALANMRAAPVGNLYYDAFHMIPWYGMFLSNIAIFAADVWPSGKKMWGAVVGMVVTCGVFGYMIGSPNSFIREKIDTAKEFNDGYGTYFAKGEVVRQLAVTGDTMFVEMWEDPIYFVAGVPSAYRYSWYTSVMPLFAKYQLAREDMFTAIPPTFYIGACTKDDRESAYLSEKAKLQYVQLVNSGKPSCVYVQKSVVPRITKDVSARIQIYGYSLP